MTISELIGKTILSVDVNRDRNVITFNCATGEQYKMYHCQDCYESVTIEDICGDLDDLVGTPILKAEEISNYEPTSEKERERMKEAESYRWTFYKLATMKGYVDIRWYGESNGYYSESVDFDQIN